MKLEPLAPGRRWRIVPKLDFGSGPGYYIDGKYVKKGFIVTDGFCNMMPGAIWFQTKAQASIAITIYADIASVGGDSDTFHLRLRKALGK